MSGDRITPVDGFEARLGSTIPPEVRKSIPEDASRDLIALRLAEECKRSDDRIEKLNEERRLERAAYAALVREVRANVIPLYVKLGVFFGFTSFGISVGILAFHICMRMGHCQP